MLTLIDHLPWGGGAERFAAEVAGRLNPERFDSRLCVSRAPRDPRGATLVETADLDQLQAAGLETLTLGRRSTFAFWTWRPLIRQLRRGEVDVLHAHKYGSNVWASLLGSAARTPVVIAHEHSWAFEGDPVRRFLDRNLIARLSDKVIAVSREDRRRMIEVERIPAKKVEFVPFGIDSLPVPEGDLRRDLGIDPDAPVVGAVGGLRPEKGLLTLLDAAARMRDALPGLRVLIVGEGPQRDQLSARIEELGLASVVILAGHRRDVPMALEAIDVAVLCSEREGSPLAVFEYMDAGKPIVATGVGGVPDLIDDGVHGLLVPPHDPAALCDAVSHLIRDRDRASRLGEAARRRRRGEFTIQATVGRIEAIYEDLYTARTRSRMRR